MIIEPHKRNFIHHLLFVPVVIILVYGLRNDLSLLFFIIMAIFLTDRLSAVIVQANEAELSVGYPTNPFKRNRKVAWGLVDTMYIRSKSSIIDGFHARSYFRVYLQSGDRFEVSYNFSKADVERLKALSEKVGFKLIVNASLKDYVEGEEEGK